ncbi:hypothetical protein, partial [Pseudomonas citronellolis]|uniref:hypothetical protein n=1 Tax=Pseudomonas citronellolis TaxID=53408 RepID=UPI003AAA6D82
SYVKSEKAWLFSQPRIRVETRNPGCFLTSWTDPEVFTQPARGGFFMPGKSIANVTLRSRTAFRRSELAREQ